MRVDFRQPAQQGRGARGGGHPPHRARRGAPAGGPAERRHLQRGAGAADPRLPPRGQPRGAEAGGGDSAAAAADDLRAGQPRRRLRRRHLRGDGHQQHRQQGRDARARGDPRAGAPHHRRPPPPHPLLRHRLLRHLLPHGHVLPEPHQPRGGAGGGGHPLPAGPAGRLPPPPHHREGRLVPQQPRAPLLRQSGGDLRQRRPAAADSAA
mmetsp:Transcript_39208/g.85286  ORF Transcript_39208/g.85286 Transcript_39208/m.85286 type:complete len:208 (-) Transcript_39208:195-818(-)